MGGEGEGGVGGGWLTLRGRPVSASMPKQAPTAPGRTSSCLTCPSELRSVIACLGRYETNFTAPEVSTVACEVAHLARAREHLHLDLAEVSEVRGGAQRCDHLLVVHGLPREHRDGRLPREHARQLVGASAHLVPQRIPSRRAAAPVDGWLWRAAAVAAAAAAAANTTATIAAAANTTATIAAIAITAATTAATATATATAVLTIAIAIVATTATATIVTTATATITTLATALGGDGDGGGGGSVAASKRPARGCRSALWLGRGHRGRTHHRSGRQRLYRAVNPGDGGAARRRFVERPHLDQLERRGYRCRRRRPQSRRASTPVGSEAVVRLAKREARGERPGG
eukprot:scaffold17452_cov56-Phaeocystis_antarctica.AAC.1